MIKRIVKMTFRPEAVPAFLEVFDSSKAQIRAFPGCRHMELLQYEKHPNVLFTLSIWDSEKDLDTYRESELFQTTWARTKVLFAGRAEAWTVQVLDSPA